MKTWTPDEVEILKENYNKVSNKTLAEMIPNKSSVGIYKKARKLGFYKSPDIEWINRSEARKGKPLKNGMRHTRDGYRQILIHGHPRADKSGYVMEHIAVWEDATKSSIPDGCVVHHLNGNKQDNRIENLCLMQRGAHTIYHHTGMKRSEETKAKLREVRGRINAQ